MCGGAEFVQRGGEVCKRNGALQFNSPFGSKIRPKLGHIDGDVVTSVRYSKPQLSSLIALPIVHPEGSYDIVPVPCPYVDPMRLCPWLQHIINCDVWVVDRHWRAHLPGIVKGDRMIGHVGDDI